MPRTPDTSPQTLKVFGALLDDPQGWHYGYALSKLTGLASGTLYPILMRLVERDLLETRWEPSETPGRPPRHVYRLTPDGTALATSRLEASAQVKPTPGRPATAHFAWGIGPMTAAARLVREPLLVRLSRALLTRTVRGSASEGTEWGEALLSELEEAATPAEAARWTISSLPLAWRERRKRRSAERPPRPLHVRVTRRVVVTVALLVIAGFMVNTFVATIYYQPSPSMTPSYGVGSRVLVDKLGYHLDGLKIGDVVLISVSDVDVSVASGNGPFQIGHLGTVAGPVSGLRRVAGLPGDVMTCNAAGAVTRNGNVVAEPKTGTGFPCQKRTVPAGEVYLLGDNISDAWDSRMYGPVHQSLIVGRVVSTVWPL